MLSHNFVESLNASINLLLLSVPPDWLFLKQILYSCLFLLIPPVVAAGQFSRNWLTCPSRECPKQAKIKVQFLFTSPRSHPGSLTGGFAGCSPTLNGSVVLIMWRSTSRRSKQWVVLRGTTLLTHLVESFGWELRQAADNEAGLPG